LCQNFSSKYYIYILYLIQLQSLLCSSNFTNQIKVVFSFSKRFPSLNSILNAYFPIVTARSKRSNMNDPDELGLECLKLEDDVAIEDAQCEVNSTCQERNTVHIAYTKHDERWDDSKKSVEFSQLVYLNDERPSQAFLSTFEPWTLSFIAHHFKDTETTLFVADDAFERDECCNQCDTELRTCGGIIWHCNECDRNSCSQCVDKLPHCSACSDNKQKVLLTELLPEPAFGIEEFSMIDNTYDRHRKLYRSRVEFGPNAPTILQSFQLRAIIPRVPGTFCAHTKLILLRFETCVRIIISSFNLSEIAWKGGGDAFWWMDFDIRPPPQQLRGNVTVVRKQETECKFYIPLYDFLCSIGLNDEWLSLIDSLDWKVLSARSSLSSYLPQPAAIDYGCSVHIVASVPGAHSDSCYGWPLEISRCAAQLTSLSHPQPSY
jgi:hypothetical protein